MTCVVNYSNVNGILKCQFENYFMNQFLYQVNGLAGYAALMMEFDGRRWCCFHCPVESPEGVPSEKRNWNENTLENFRAGLAAFVDAHVLNKEDEIDLSYIVFPDGYHMDNLVEDLEKFGGNVNFQYCEFYEEINVRSRRLNQFNFNGAIFYRLISLIKCSLSYSSFLSVHFKDGTSFIGSSFLACKFDNASFDEHAVFTESIFVDSIAETDEKTSFKKAIFYKDASFTNANFATGTVINNIEFRGFADFSISDVVFFKNDLKSDGFNVISFEGCNFQAVDFTNRKFKLKTNFSSCIFNKAPHFFGCTFHQHIIFPPQKNFKDVASDDAAHAYRVLYRGMSDIKDRGYESMFYALVQKSERRSGEQPYHVKLTSWLYEVTTNYGQDIGRPIFWLLISTVIFACIYAFLSSPIINIDARIDWNIVGQGIDLSIKQIVKPFAFYPDKYMPNVEPLAGSYPVLFKLYAVLETVVSWSLIALLLLSLRWKFKKD